MIKVENGTVEIKGKSVDLCTDLTLAVRGLREALENSEMPKEVAEGVIREAVNLAFKTEDELRKEAESKLGGLLLSILLETLAEGDEADE